jgi:hypothetical protein
VVPHWQYTTAQHCGRCMILCLHAAFSPCVCSLPAGVLVPCLACMCYLGQDACMCVSRVSS